MVAQLDGAIVHGVLCPDHPGTLEHAARGPTGRLFHHQPAAVAHVVRVLYDGLGGQGLTGEAEHRAAVALATGDATGRRGISDRTTQDRERCDHAIPGGIVAHRRRQLHARANACVTTPCPTDVDDHVGYPVPEVGRRERHGQDPGTDGEVREGAVRRKGDRGRIEGPGEGVQGRVVQGDLRIDGRGRCRSVVIIQHIERDLGHVARAQAQGRELGSAEDVLHPSAAVGRDERRVALVGGVAGICTTRGRPRTADQLEALVGGVHHALLGVLQALIACRGIVHVPFVIGAHGVVADGPAQVSDGAVRVHGVIKAYTAGHVQGFRRGRIPDPHFAGGRHPHPFHVVRAEHQVGGIGRTDVVDRVIGAGVAPEVPSTAIGHAAPGRPRAGAGVVIIPETMLGRVVVGLVDPESVRGRHHRDGQPVGLRHPRDQQAPHRGHPGDIDHGQRVRCGTGGVDGDPLGGGGQGTGRDQGGKGGAE